MPPSNPEEAIPLTTLDDPPSPTASLPDSPLTSPTQTQPRWLRHRRAPFALDHRIVTSRIADLLRPRRTWRYILFVASLLYVLFCLARGSPLLASSLPGYETGEYDVGAIDLEVPLEKPRRLSDTVFKGSGQPAYELETVLFTLYYPVAKGTKSSRPRHSWLDRPISPTAAGYAKFAHVNNFLIRPVFTFALWAIAGNIKIPAEVDAPLAGTGEESLLQGFPVMVFSHGMASSRTDYTNYIGELAGRGHVIAAVEHRDGSCPGTVIRVKGKRDRRLIHFSENDLRSDPPMDTPTIKREQLAFRDAEIFETIRILQSINNGKGNDTFLSNPRGEGSSLDTWAHRLDLARLTIGGHSYGATGALQALRGPAAGDIPKPIGGIALDPGKSSGPLNTDISVPILVIHSNSWSKQRSIFFGRPHFDAVRDLVKAALERNGESWFFTSIGTSHPSVSDAPLIEPLLLSWTTGASLNVKEALRQYVKVSADFFRYLGGDKARDLLAEPVTHEEYGKWVNADRKNTFPSDLAKLWEIHISPAST